MKTVRINGSGGKVSHRKLGEATHAALQNEQHTRSRVDHLERGMDQAITVLASHGEDLSAHVSRLAALEQAWSRSFGGRMRWLVTGR